MAEQDVPLDEETDVVKVNYASGRQIVDGANIKRQCRIDHVIDDRIFKTVCVFVAYWVLGLESPLLGNTIVHLERLFDADTATMSLAFTVYSIGYLVGALACGFIFDRTNHELAFAIDILVNGLVIISEPFLGQLGGLTLFLGTLLAQATTQGFLDAIIVSYAVGLWIGHRYLEPILQAANALWSLGGVIGPFIIGRFLVELPQSVLPDDAHQYQSTTSSFSSNDSVIWRTDSPPRVLAATTAASSSMEFSSISGSSMTSSANLSLARVPVTSAINSVDVSRVRFAFVTIGSLAFVPGLLFAVAYFRGRSRRVRRAETSGIDRPKTGSVDREEIAIDDRLISAETPVETVPAAVTSDKHDRPFFITFVVLIFLFYNFYAYIEMIPVAYLTTFTVKFLWFPVADASLLVSVFYGCQLAGRVLAVPLSAWLRPQTMVLFSLSLTAVSFLTILCFVGVWPAVVWPAIALAGLAMSTIYMAVVLWIAERGVVVTGRIASVILAGWCLGCAIGTQFVGRLFDATTPMCFVYIIVAGSLVLLALFGAMLLFVARFGDRLKTTKRTTSTTANVGDAGVHSC